MVLVNILRAQGIEVGQLSSNTTVGSDTLKAGSYVIKLDQPYGRLAKNLLEKQDYPDPALSTYDDSGWTMGFAFNVDVKQIDDKAILDVRVTPVKQAEWHGTGERQRQRRHRGRALRLEQHDHVPLPPEERGDEDRGRAVHGGGRRRSRRVRSS